jgi:hypothetical protein
MPRSKPKQDFSAYLEQVILFDNCRPPALSPHCLAATKQEKRKENATENQNRFAEGPQLKLILCFAVTSFTYKSFCYLNLFRSSDFLAFPGTFFQDFS